MSTQSRIVTPEAVVLDFERAGVASRTLAIALDGLSLATIWVVLVLIVQIAGRIESVAGAVLAVVVSIAFYLLWFAGFETYQQRTPGKMALGLRVVSPDGTPVRFQQAFLRALLGLIDFFLLPVGGVAVLASLLSPTDQRLGDMAAGTLVVRQRAVGPAAAPARFVPPPGMEGYARSLDVSRMTVEHYELVRRFLLRAHELAHPARGQMAVTLANPLARLLGHTPPPMLHPELFLVSLAASWQAAHGAASVRSWAAPAPASPPPPGTPGPGPGVPPPPPPPPPHHQPPPPPAPAVPPQAPPSDFPSLPS